MHAQASHDASLGAKWVPSISHAMIYGSVLLLAVLHAAQEVAMQCQADAWHAKE